MYAPHRVVCPVPAADKPADVCAPPLDDCGLLVRPSLLPTVRPLPAPAPAPAPAPVPAPAAQPLSLTLPLVSDGFSADLEFARQLMQFDEENLHAAALDSLRLEDVVPQRSHLGVKYAYAPSRARRAHHAQRISGSPSSMTSSSHSSPATSATSRGFSLPLSAPDEREPFHDGPRLRPSQSHPVLSAQSHSVMSSQPVMPSQPVLLTQPHPLRETFSDAPAKSEGAPMVHFVHVCIHHRATEPGPASPARPAGSESPATITDSELPAMPADTSPDPPSLGLSTSKRSARTTKRSPAPRRQECQTCGKKFQRPCQLTTNGCAGDDPLVLVSTHAKFFPRSLNSLSPVGFSHLIPLDSLSLNLTLLLVAAYSVPYGRTTLMPSFHSFLSPHTSLTSFSTFFFVIDSWPNPLVSPVCGWVLTCVFCFGCGLRLGLIHDSRLVPRIQVLSNCQRHVKLCQKRSTKPSPGSEETDVAAGPSGTTSSSFITYSDSSTTEEPVRRPNEIPIRPKIVSHGSGNRSSLLGARPAALERPTPAGSSSVGVVEGDGVGSETSTVPVVPSSSYSYSSGAAGFASASGSGNGFGYDEGRAFEPPQTIYEEPSTDYASGSAYEPAGSGFDAARSSSYDPARANTVYDTAGVNPAYEPSTSGVYAASGYDALSSGGYGAPSSAYGQSGPTFEQAASSGTDYAQSAATEYAYSDYSHPSPSHVHPHPSPSHVHVQPLPSPSHVHASSPSMYGTPSMLGTPAVHTVPLMHGDSTFLAPTTPGPGMTVSRSMSVGNHATVPVSRRASASMTRRSTLSAMNSHDDALGFATEPVLRRQPIVPSDPVAQPFLFQRSPADLVNRGLEPEVKPEDEGGDGWTPAPAPVFQAGYQTVGGYSTPGAGRFHAYGPESGATAATSAEQHPASSSGYSYAQQQAQQQQLYGQQPPGFTPQLDGEQSRDGYTNGVGYADPSSLAPESDAGRVAKLPHQHYPEYPWPGAESRWNDQSGYNS
ncbi:hypothetical protein FRC10_007996 [Ceratobasidium sp. 414]|nr:hypothetical protein FRC10_007996 [Ceratobasidium sp. 414]